MIPNVAKKNFDAAMQYIRDELATADRIIAVFRKAQMKAHPDKGGEQETFNVLEDLKRSVMELVNKGASATKAEKFDFAQTMKQLPEDVRNAIVDFVIKAQPQFTAQSLLNPVAFTVHNKYSHKASNPMEGRSQIFNVDAHNFSQLKEQFQDAKGDYLKTKILQDFQAQIEDTTSPEALKTLVEKLKASDEYDVLNTRQGLFSKITRMQTSSVKALNEMIKEQEANLTTGNKLDK